MVPIGAAIRDLFQSNANYVAHAVKIKLEPTPRTRTYKPTLFTSRSALIQHPVVLPTGR